MLQSYPRDSSDNEMLVKPAQTLDEPLQLLLASHAMSFGNEWTLVGYPDSQLMSIATNVLDPDFTNTSDIFPYMSLINSANAATRMRSKYPLDPDTGKVSITTSFETKEFNTTKRPWYYDSTTNGNFTTYVSATDGVISYGYSKSFFQDDTSQAKPPNITGVASCSKPISILNTIMQTIVKNDPKALIYVFERITDWERNNTNSPPNNYIVASSDPKVQTSIKNPQILRNICVFVCWMLILCL